jgi:lipoprotein-anchoring transpeptidase ErfK/SrfK
MGTPEPTLSEGFQVDVPMSTPSELPVDTPISPADLPTNTPEPIETPAQLAMDIIPNTPTSAYVQPTAASGSQQSYASVGNGVRWIDVDLSNQRVYAYEGDVMINSFLVSTGTWATPTVTGQYRVYVKYGSATMSGPGYYLPNVPYVMYFYKGYGLHGTYWHNNFGTPMSHGCVNLRTDDAGWLFNWASVGTLVNVHY